MKTTNYVVGLMFDNGMRQVALIRKTKPSWQAGMLNGIGGKIEDGESESAAMVREFNEEAGVKTEPEQWNNFLSMSGKNNDGECFSVEFFFTIGNLAQLRPQEAEKIEVHAVANVAGGYETTIGNLPWIVACAVDFGLGVYPPSKVRAFY